MSKLKIVRIIARLNIGGPAINASILSSFLDKDIFQTKVLYGSLARGEAGLEHIMRRHGIDMELIPELGRDISPIGDIKAFWKIYRILLKEKPDIVHTHTAKAGTLGRAAAAMAGVKVKVHTFHGNIFKEYFGKIKTSLFIFIEKTLALITTKVVTVSERQREELVREFKIVPESKCSVVPLGLDFSRLELGKAGDDEACVKKDLGMKADELLVGIIGRLVPIKNHRMFLDAAHRVCKDRPDIKVRFAVIGGGELENELKAYAASIGMGEKVYFLGWREDLKNIYKGLDVVALTSLNEGTPLALIEAMAMGKAILATNVGGVSDIIKDGESGLLVDKGDLENFTTNLTRLLEDEMLRIKLGQSAKVLSARFDKDNLVRAMTELYKECMAVT